jgi:ribose 1,5-bisphosphokinase
MNKAISLAQIYALIENELASRPFPIRSGCFLAVVGPSGAGKDTLIGFARRELVAETGVHFVRRVITRPSDGGTEDHDTLAMDAFERAEADGAFALSWRAHGLGYGLPVGIDEHMANGMVVVANGSRAVIPALRERYVNVVPALVTAEPHILAERLAARGRETRDEVLARLSRQTAQECVVSGAFEIANNGKPDEAGRALVGLIRRALASAAVSDAI